MFGLRNQRLIDLLRGRFSLETDYTYELSATTCPSISIVCQQNFFHARYRRDTRVLLNLQGRRVLEVSGVGCLRGERPLFVGVSFKLASGGLIWIQGGNGSGKTTLLRTLCGLTQAMAGNVRWRGETIQALGEDYRRELTYIGHANGLKEDLSALENLRIAAQLAGQSVSHEEGVEALRGSGLAGREHLPVKFLSQGQRRRAALARLRLPHPRTLWLLDEPFNALDVHAVTDLRHMMERHLARGGMIALTTHQDVDIQAADSQALRLDA